MLLLLSACRSDDTESDIRGIWETKVTFEQPDNDTDSIRLTLSLDQDGDAIFGTFAGTDGSGGELEGTLDNRTLELNLFQSTPCPGNLGVVATLADEDDGDLRQFVGTLIGTSCQGKIAAAVTANRRTDTED